MGMKVVNPKPVETKVVKVAEQLAGELKNLKTRYTELDLVFVVLESQNTDFYGTYFKIVY